MVGLSYHVRGLTVRNLQLTVTIMKIQVSPMVQGYLRKLQLAQQEFLMRNPAHGPEKIDICPL